MRALAVTAAVIALTANPHIALAGSYGFSTGNNLLADCTATSALRTNYCYGYLAGIHDTVARTFADWDISCTPKGITLEQVADIVVKYLRDHAERRQEAASALARSAIMEAWYPPEIPEVKQR